MNHMRFCRWLSKATLETIPSIPWWAAFISALYWKLSFRLRDASTDQGTTLALSRSDTPQRTMPASHSERVVAKIFSPAARTAVISLLRCNLLSTNSSDSSIESGSTIERLLGISVA